MALVAKNHYIVMIFEHRYRIAPKAKFVEYADVKCPDEIQLGLFNYSEGHRTPPS